MHRELHFWLPARWHVGVGRLPRPLFNWHGNNSQLSRHWRDIVEEAYRFKLCNLTVNVEKAAEVVRRVVRHVENVKP